MKHNIGIKLKKKCGKEIILKMNMLWLLLNFSSASHSPFNPWVALYQVEVERMVDYIKVERMLHAKLHMLRLYMCIENLKTIETL